jgi:hypothetical protein
MLILLLLLPVPTPTCAAMADCFGFLEVLFTFLPTPVDADSCADSGNSMHCATMTCFIASQAFSHHVAKRHKLKMARTRAFASVHSVQMFLIRNPAANRICIEATIQSKRC